MASDNSEFQDEVESILDKNPEIHPEEGNLESIRTALEAKSEDYRESSEKYNKGVKISRYVVPPVTSLGWTPFGLTELAARESLTEPSGMMEPKVLLAGIVGGAAIGGVIGTSLMWRRTGWKRERNSYNALAEEYQNFDLFENNKQSVQNILQKAEYAEGFLNQVSNTVSSDAVEQNHLKFSRDADLNHAISFQEENDAENQENYTFKLYAVTAEEEPEQMFIAGFGDEELDEAYQEL